MSLYSVVRASLRALMDVTPQNTNDITFEEHYEDIKTLFCNNHSGFEIYWSEAVTFKTNAPSGILTLNGI